MNWDYDLFLWLNFDGGLLMDYLMLFASSRVGWAPIYLLILYMLGRKVGWRRMLLFICMVVGAVVLADMFAGIFKHVGVLKSLAPDFPARLRPMYCTDLGGVVHVLTKGGLYGTVSAHAATSTAICILSSLAVRRWWLTLALIAQTLTICYSRIYLAYHFPQDILIGIAVGIVSAAIMAIIGVQIEKKLPPIGTR
ncbi:MAG: phosphatase PAP2 family protein [Rikenellaceae bacterium]